MINNKLPEGFILLDEYAPQLCIDLKYRGDDNLLARPLRGYERDASAILTAVAADSLISLQKLLGKPSILQDLNMQEPQLVIYDAYRPQMACDDFWEWSQSTCDKTKQAYYPNLNKRDFFDLGYIARKSSHSRGSTVDLTIRDALSGECLSMGTTFDFMDPLSHPDNPSVAPDVFRNRQFLKKIMNDLGWQGIPTEWWHFTYEQEPYPDTYFNFPVINYST